LGARLALEIGALHPERAHSLVLVDYGLFMSEQTSRHIVQNLVEQFRQYRSIDEYRNWLAQTRPIANDVELRRIANGALRRSQQGYELRCDPGLTEREQSEQSTDEVAEMLRRLICRVLLVRGEASAALSHQAALDTLHHVRHGMLATVPSAGHAVMTDNPSGFLQVLRPFLAGTNQFGCAWPYGKVSQSP
jgi:pimeloyl-ACP methyl ester carboxylesterase